MKKQLSFVHNKKYFDNFLLPILDFSGIIVDNKGYLYNGDSYERNIPFKFENSGKHPICAYFEEAVFELLSNKEERVIFDPINIETHNIVLFNMVKYAIFYSLPDIFDTEYVDNSGEFHEKTHEMILEDINKYIQLTYNKGVEEGMDEFNLLVINPDTDEENFICRMRILSGATMNIKRFLFYFEIAKRFNPNLIDNNDYDVVIDYDNGDHNYILRRKYVSDFYELINNAEKERKNNYKLLKDVKFNPSTFNNKNEEFNSGEKYTVNFESTIKEKEREIANIDIGNMFNNEFEEELDYH